MNFLLNSKMMKVIFSKIIENSIKKNGFNASIDLHEFKVENVENEEIFSIKLTGKIKDDEIVNVLKKIGVL